MTLATHAVVGASLAELFPSHPVVAFSIGFLSHFILDALPHWDYKILSSYSNPDLAMEANNDKDGGIASQNLKPDRLFKLDILHIGADASLGAALVIILWQPHSLWQFFILALGAFGGILPDFLQFVYMRFPHQPMVAIQYFHHFMHAKSDLKSRPFIGIASQIVVMAVAFVLVKYLIGL